MQARDGPMYILLCTLYTSADGLVLADLFCCGRWKGKQSASGALKSLTERLNRLVRSVRCLCPRERREMTKY